MLLRNDNNIFTRSVSNRIRYNALTAVLTYFLLWGGSFYLGKLISAPVVSLLASENTLGEAARATVRRLLVCGVQIAVFFFWVKYVEKRPVATLGLISRHKFRSYGVGLLLGISAISLVAALLTLTGSVLPIGNASLSTSLLAGVVLMAAGWMVQSASEEIGLRGWLIPVLGNRYGAVAAVTIAAVVFGAIHIFNPDVTVMSILNLALSGAFYALYALWEDSIWGVCGWHMGWNFAQSNLYGFSTSGAIVEGGSVFSFLQSGNSLLTGGKFGPEGGLITTALLVLGICALLIARKRRSRTAQIS